MYKLCLKLYGGRNFRAKHCNSHPVTYSFCRLSGTDQSCVLIFNNIFSLACICFLCWVFLLRAETWDFLDCIVSLENVIKVFQWFQNISIHLKKPTELHDPYRDCFGIFICSNSQSSNPNHNTCYVELWSNLAAHFSSGKLFTSQKDKIYDVHNSRTHSLPSTHDIFATIHLHYYDICLCGIAFRFLIHMHCSYHAY